MSNFKSQVGNLNFDQTTCEYVVIFPIKIYGLKYKFFSMQSMATTCTLCQLKKKNYVPSGFDT